jgi:hypothetical protein
LENKADLHTHSLASDGTRPAAQIVGLAKQAGLAAVAITDHDTVAGVEEALEEGRKLGIDVVPGVEISTAANGKEIHVLGYFVDWRDASFLSRLERLRNTRNERNEMMIEKLNELGLQVTMEEVLAEAGRTRQDGESVGRPHIAALLVRKGYVGSVQEAFDRYLGAGAAAYVNPPRIRPEEAIRWIKEAGGAAVLAHPGLYGADRLVDEWIAAGLDGLEAYHSDHSPEQERKYALLASRHGLIVTAGSDYHGERNGRAFHGPIGARTTDAATVGRLRAKRRK